MRGSRLRGCRARSTNTESISTAVAAIDIHTHVEVDGHGRKAYDDELVDAVGQYFKMGPGALSSVDALADEYRRHNTAAVVFTIDARTGMRHVPNSVEDLVAGAIRNNDVLIPFGSVDPWHERRAVHRVHELVRDYGVKGFKFHPSMQAFEPNDRRFYPIYEAITEAGVPALFHTGQTGIGAGLPGGHGIKLRYSDPMLLDDVAADFPELTIVMAHPAVPWVDSQIAIASHKTNVYVDLSRLVAEVLSAATGARHRAGSCGRRCCSERTTRTSRWTAGAATSRRWTSTRRWCR